jgi:hypothetical protein
MVRTDVNAESAEMSLQTWEHNDGQESIDGGIRTKPVCECAGQPQYCNAVVGHCSVALVVSRCKKGKYSYPAI